MRNIFGFQDHLLFTHIARHQIFEPLKQIGSIGVFKSNALLFSMITHFRNCIFARSGLYGSMYRHRLHDQLHQHCKQHNTHSHFFLWEYGLLEDSNLVPSLFPHLYLPLFLPA